MISFNIIQSMYTDLYRELRKYIWDFNVIEQLADLEVACHRRLPNTDDILRCYDKLNRSVSEVAREDEDLRNALDAFYNKLTEGNGQVYAKLQQVREVIN